jgi:glyoxylase-like metal-dependent hydrolase (beta-lactamase superfamily II)
LVDAGNYSLFAAADPSYSLQGYVPPPPLKTQLENIGVGRHDVTHVVITHAHYDHYAGVTEKIGETYSPTFPSARYYLGRAEWENPEMQKALSAPESAESISLGVLHSLDLLELVDAESVLSQEVSVLPCPGESPGHQIVRLSSMGQNLYCLGDLFHHAVEIENIKLMSSWCDSPTNIKSREELLTRALAEDAVLVAAHMPPGRLSDTSEGLRFIAI